MFNNAYYGPIWNVLCINCLPKRQQKLAEPASAAPIQSNTLMTSVQSDRRSYDSDITPQERFWVDQQPFLLAHGYRLRPRYDPAWVPSWKWVSAEAVKDYLAEDARMIHVRGINIHCMIGSNVCLETKCTRCHPNPRWSESCAQARPCQGWRDSHSLTFVLCSNAFWSSKSHRSYLGHPNHPRSHWWGLSCHAISSSIPLPSVPLSSGICRSSPPISSSERAGFNDRLIYMIYMLTSICRALSSCMSKTSHTGNLMSSLSEITRWWPYFSDACLFNLLMDESRVIPKGSHFGRTDSHDGSAFNLTWQHRCSSASIIIILTLGYLLGFRTAKTPQLILVSLVKWNWSQNCLTMFLITRFKLTFISWVILSLKLSKWVSCHDYTGMHSYSLKCIDLPWPPDVCAS